MRESDIVICGHGSGTPSTKNMEAYLTSRYKQFADNGLRKGLVAVRRLKQMTDSGREKFYDFYKTILGRNIYSQNLRQFVYTPYGGRYYSDCSSSICATYQQIGYSVSLLNTAGIYTSDLFEDVPVKIEEGHVKNPEVLRVGDCLLFRGNDPSRPLQIGHVEAVYKMITDYKEYPVEATLTTTAEQLNIRNAPDGDIIGTYPYGSIVEVSAKSGKWFKTRKGWISRNYCVGWVKEPNPYKVYWYIENGSYPIFCARDIGGDEYHFDRDGWLIERERISTTGSVIY